MPDSTRFEAPQGLPLFDVQFRAISEALGGNGVVSPTDLEPTAGTGDLDVNVASGTAYYGGSEYTLGSASTVTLSAGGSTGSRWDTVYFDTATTSVGVREGQVGDPANGVYPSPPDVQGDEMLIAVVHVTADTTIIDANDIQDWRAEFPNDAPGVRYADSTGQFGSSTVAGALDALQYAAQISAYPLAAGDLKSGMAKTWTAKHRYEAAQEWQEMATPTNPATGYYRFYVKSDGNLYKLAPDGTETQVGGSSGTTGVTVEDDGTVLVDPATAINFGTDLAVTDDGDDTVTVNNSGTGVSADVIEQGESGTVAAGNSGVVARTHLADQETIEIQRAVLTLIDAQPAPTGLNLTIITENNSGGATAQTTILSGDGSTVYDKETGSPLASYQNTSGSGRTVAVVIDNGDFGGGTGSSQDVYGDVLAEVV